MARKQDICEVPGCTNDINNRKRSLCGACASSLYYWNRRQDEEQGSLLARRDKLQFWNNRLDWLFQPSVRSPRKRRN